MSLTTWAKQAECLCMNRVTFLNAFQLSEIKVDLGCFIFHELPREFLPRD